MLFTILENIKQNMNRQKYFQIVKSICQSQPKNSSRLSTDIFLGLPGHDSLKESHSKQHKTEIKGPTKYWFMDDMLCVWTFQSFQYTRPFMTRTLQKCHTYDKYKYWKRLSFIQTSKKKYFGFYAFEKYIYTYKEHWQYGLTFNAHSIRPSSRPKSQNQPLRKFSQFHCSCNFFSDFFRRFLPLFFLVPVYQLFDFFCQ